MFYNFADITINEKPLDVLFFVIIVIPILLFTFLVSLFVNVYLRRKKLQKKVILTEYLAPPNLKPAELGYLYDTKVREIELYACIFDLENRQKLRIDVSNGKSLIVAVQNDNGLDLHEKYIIDKFTGKEIDGFIPIESLVEFGRQLRQDLVNKGYMEGSYFIAIIKRSLKFILFTYLPSIILFSMLIFIGFMNNSNISVIVSIIITIIVAVSASIIIFPGLLIVGILGCLISVRIIGNNWLRTKKLDEIWDKIEGYRIYLRKVELDRLVFNNENYKENSVNEIQPYAIALGYDTKWRERFKNK